MKVFVFVLFSALASGCISNGQSQSGVLSAPAPGGKRVVVRIGAVPEGARELGPLKVEASRTSQFADALLEFRDAAAALGADYAKIDDIQLVSGSATSGSGADTHDYGVISVTLIGRAFKTGAP